MGVEIPTLLMHVDSTPALALPLIEQLAIIRLSWQTTPAKKLVQRRRE